MALRSSRVAGSIGVIELLADRGLEAWDIGSIVADAAAGPTRYVEEGG